MDSVLLRDHGNCVLYLLIKGKREEPTLKECSCQEAYFDLLLNIQADGVGMKTDQLQLSKIWELSRNC